VEYWMLGSMHFDLRAGPLPGRVAALRILGSGGLRIAPLRYGQTTSKFFEPAPKVFSNSSVSRACYRYNGASQKNLFQNETGEK